MARLRSGWMALSALAGVAVLAGIAYVGFDGYGTDTSKTEQTASVSSDALARGEALFGKLCADCHGAEAQSTDQGPPLVHKIYEPSHHSDEAFVLAALRGTRAHHWNFGDMPPVEGITPEEIPPIIAYVRALQRDAGIR